MFYRHLVNVNCEHILAYTFHNDKHRVSKGKQNVHEQVRERQKQYLWPKNRGVSQAIEKVTARTCR